MKNPKYNVLCMVSLLMFSYNYSFATLHILETKTTTVNIYKAADFNYKPGDTLCVPSGTIRGLRFHDFVGDVDNPIVITNYFGKTIIEESTYGGIWLNNCKYIKLTGLSSSNAEYNFVINKTKASTPGIELSNFSTDIEIEHIEIANTGFAGILAKTDPNCTDYLTWRRNGFIMKNIIIHDNYIHDTGGEGMYIGYTGGYKVESKKICNGEYVFGHFLENVQIYDNVVENAGWDGIQVNLVRKDAIIHNNVILNYGLLHEKFQNFGLSLGSGDVQLYNNYIQNDNPDSGSMGMQLISATSGSYVIGNVLVNSDGYGIFIHNRHDFDSLFGYFIINNTIINPGMSETKPASAIMYNSCITLSDKAEMVGDCQENVASFFINNLIINPGVDYAGQGTWKGDKEAYVDFNTRALRDSNSNNIVSNFFTRDIDTLRLVNPSENNFQLADSLSPLFNKGMNVSDYPNTGIDILGNERPLNGIPEIGAYEKYFGSSSTLIKNIVEHNFLLYPNPASNTITIRGDIGDEKYLKVYNVKGEAFTSMVKVIEHMVSNTTLDISRLKHGIYFLKTQYHSNIIYVE